MTDEAMSPLRRRMIEDMTIRKLSPKTQQGYIRTIKDFAAFLGRSPDTASFEDVRRFQLHLAANGAHIPILNPAVLFQDHAQAIRYHRAHDVHP
jgi:integrase/recombinase XerD